MQGQTTGTCAGGGLCCGQGEEKEECEGMRCPTRPCHVWGWRGSGGCGGSGGAQVFIHPGGGGVEKKQVQPVILWDDPNHERIVTQKLINLLLSHKSLCQKIQLLWRSPYFISRQCYFVTKWQKVISSTRINICCPVASSFIQSLESTK